MHGKDLWKLTMKIKLEPIYQANVRISGNTVKGQFAYITINDKKYKITRCIFHKGKFNDEKMYMLFTLENAKVLGFISIRSDATSIKPIGNIQEFPKEIIGNMSTFDFIMDYIDKDEVWNQKTYKEEK